MPVPLIKGQWLAGYTVIEELSRGTSAIAFKVRHDDGRLIFLKQYTEPTRANAWFEQYVEYEKEKKRRIEASKAKDFCLAPIEIFVAKNKVDNIFQAFEFVERGDDLRAVLRRMQAEHGESAWKRRLIYAKVFLAALEAVAEQRIVHGDLKPENIHLIENKAIEAGYRPKLIDMDASLMTDIKPPWSPDKGFVGTPNYYSPEHDVLPEPCSDVFTAALILHELLCKERPYREYSRAAEVAALIRAAPAPTPILRGTLGDPHKDDHLKKTLQDCLALDPKKRPTVSELREAVLGGAKSGPTRGRLVPNPPPVAPAKPKTLRVVGPTGLSLEFNINTDFDHSLAKILSPHPARPRGRYFSLTRKDGIWLIAPASGTGKCVVRVNGAAVAVGTEVLAGATIQLTWPSEDRAALSMKVDFV
jgi:serine/threonine protein kinase